MTLDIRRRTCEDEVIDQAAWNETIRSFADGTLYAFKQDGENYVFEIDAPDEEEYVLAVSKRHIQWRPGIAFE